MTFIDRRQTVVDYIRKGIVEQGGSVGDAVVATTRIMFFRQEDVDNMYKCIKSDQPHEVIAAIIAHDFNGLSKGPDKTFLPKSSQFKEVSLV